MSASHQRVKGRSCGNFFDEEVVEPAPCPPLFSITAAAAAPRLPSHCERSDTCITLSDGDLDAMPLHAPSFSMDKLRERMEEASADVSRINGLILKALWQALLRARATPSHHPSRSSSCPPATAAHTPVQHERPFLPSDRHPNLPPVSPQAYDRFNQGLFRAVSIARSQGLLANDGQPASSKGITGRDSLWSAAMQKVASRTTTGAGGGSAARGTSKSSKAPTVLAPSVSQLILSLAKQRAVALVFIRLLRLQVQQHKDLRQEVQLRFEYYSRRRVLRRWMQAAREHCRWRKLMLHRVICTWQSTVFARQRHRARMCRFASELRSRRQAFEDVQQSQAKRCLHRWLSRFIVHREHRSLNLRAEQFARQHPTSSAREVHQTTNTHPRVLARHALQRWKEMSKQRSSLHRADVVYHTNLMRSAMDKWISLRRSASTCTSNTEAASSSPTHLSPPLSTSNMPTRRSKLVVVAPADRRLDRYKMTCAERLSSNAVLRHSFTLWRDRHVNRVAVMFSRQRGVERVWRVWVSRLCTRQMQRATQGAVLTHWRKVLWIRTQVVMALAFERHSILQLSLARWRERAHVQQQQRNMVARCCLRHWWARTALLASLRARDAQVQRSALLHWKHRMESRIAHSAAVLAADTVRETIVLMRCFGRWGAAYAQHRHVRLSHEVLESLAMERLRRHCFTKWKRRAFGPSLPKALPLAPPSHHVL